ncbi:hypothetical protein [Streptomyces roseolus]|uniref:hypothetical protein n=1 Tax=Streptomyces roseolus TaxID=67358 RepID=UPI0037A61C8A
MWLLPSRPGAVDSGLEAWPDLPLPGVKPALGAAAAYAAFCCEHWEVYRRYAGVVTGDPATGEQAARAAFGELRAQWSTALRSPAPSALAWRLLGATTALSRTLTMRTLQLTLDSRQVDALVLHHRLGLSAQQAGHAMGITPTAFELLRRNALRRAAASQHVSHMPPSDAP